LSQVITDASGKPSSRPTSTSDLICRMVVVTGATVTPVTTVRAASRVRTQTGLRP
jgi:hypothetical protein